MALVLERVRSLLAYNPQTGELKWRVTRGSVQAGAAAGTLNLNGYVQVKIDGRIYGAHRIAWLIAYGKWPRPKIDHRNRVRSDNRLSNLRLATNTENTRNRGRHINNTSGVTGVFWNRKTRKWLARISVDNRQLHLGCFDNFDDAVAARRAAEKEHYGEFARAA